MGRFGRPRFRFCDFFDVIGKAAEGGGGGEAASKEQRQEEARRRDGLYEIRQELLKCVARRKCLENAPAVRALLKGGEGLARQLNGLEELGGSDVDTTTVMDPAQMELIHQLSRMKSEILNALTGSNTSQQ